MNDIEGLKAAAPFLLGACLLAFLSIRVAGDFIGYNIDDSDEQQGCGMILLTILALPAFLLLLIGLVAGIIAALP